MADSGGVFIAVVSMVALFVAIPSFALLMNFSGYSQLNTQEYQAMQTEDFNILSFSGFSTAITFLQGLSFYTIQNVGWYFAIMFLFIGLLGIVALVFWLRGFS